MFKSMTAGAAGLLLAASVSFAGSIGQAERKDLQVAKDIATSVQRYTQFTIFDDVNANVTDGVVTLTGVVQSEVDRMLARSLATQFGALSVTNALKTDAEVGDTVAKSE